MSETNKPFLEVKNLEVQYTSGGEIIHAVNDVSLTLERGKTLALVGETGAGKTTLAKSILRVLPDRAAKINKGEIFLEGRDLLKISEQDMRKVRGRKVSMIFQDPMTSLNPTMTVGDQISEVVQLHNDISKAKAMEHSIKMLKMVGITAERYSEYPHQFSGGMRQRVVIAMALACTPDLLLADEPTTALDVTIQAQILEMIEDLRKKYNSSMILITHDLAVVGSVADSVAVIYAGEILEYGSKELIYDNPTHPYTIGLFGAIPNIEADAHRLANIEGLPPNPVNLPSGCCFSPRCPYANDKCKSEKPQLIEVVPGHFCRCSNLENVKKEAGND